MTANIPKPVIDLLNSNDPAWRGRQGVNRIPDREVAIYDGRLVVTYEGWDWEEALNICDTHNVKMVYEADYLNGPGVRLYTKRNVDQPGYVLLVAGEEYFYIEWN